jgi:uncharacterized membrane protein YccC
MQRTRVVALAGQMDWLRGLRAAVALCAPLVLGDVTGIPNLGWAALGGFEAILADTGGPYRTRLGSLATLSLGGAAGCFLGSLTGGNLALAAPVTVLFCFLWSYLAVLGQPFSSAGLLVQVLFVCGVGAPASSAREALGYALLLLAGGAWAAVLSLFLWPLDPYRPARAAVSVCYEELASFLGSVTELAGRERQRAALWHRLAKHHQYRVRRAVEQGWQAVASVRAERGAETAQGRHLVVLLEVADLLIARTVALAEHLETRAGETRVGAEQGLSKPGLDELRRAELWVAALLMRRRGETLATARAVRATMESLPQLLAALVGEADGGRRFLRAQVTEAAGQLETAIESAALLRLGKELEIPLTASASHVGYVVERLGQLRQGWNLEQLRANFTRESLILRHAVRVALVCGLDVALIHLLRIDHGYWLLLTSLIVLQPHVSGTLRRGLERIGGTVAGGIVAAVLAVALHSQLATAAVLFPLAVLALAVLPVSYAAFSFFLTPAFVLAWLPHSGDWQLAVVRIVNTIAGALISLAAMTFLFPAWERDRTPVFLRASIAANRRYLEQLIAGWESGARGRNSRLLANARRGTGLAHNDTEESLERLLAEAWPRKQPFAQFVAAFVTYLRRFAQSVTALAALEGEGAWKQSFAVRSRLELLDKRLLWLETHTAASAENSPWPEPDFRALQSPMPRLTAEMTPPQNHPGERLLERLERQTEVLYRQLFSLQQHGWMPGTAD